jgi:hypothetical protein
MGPPPISIAQPTVLPIKDSKKTAKPTIIVLYIFFDGKGVQHGLCDGAHPGEGPGVGTWYRQARVAAANLLPLNYVYERGLEYLKRVHLIPVVVTIFMYLYQSGHIQRHHEK